MDTASVTFFPLRYSSYEAGRGRSFMGVRLAWKWSKVQPPMSCRFGHEKIPVAIVPSPQIQDVQFSLCSVVSYWKKDVREVMVNSQAYRGTVCR